MFIWAHIYYTFSRLLTAVYKSDGAAISTQVLNDFSNAYGKEMADKLTSYRDVDFNFIP